MLGHFIASKISQKSKVICTWQSNHSVIISFATVILLLYFKTRCSRLLSIRLLANIVQVLHYAGKTFG